ncbi:MAG: coenzyme synthesis protein [Gammaproteobacteria bacterium]|jgi:pyrroloquinoline-quinone synthase|nr:coenzyme synthesis protein [Gammaproteobacteria bacterium]
MSLNWQIIDDTISQNSLLNSAFYVAWSKGQLTVEDLQYYAGQYYALESTFPRLISSVHASCEDPEMRQVLLENLVDEERGNENHRELWLRFAEGLGLDREQVMHAERNEATQACIDTLMALAKDPNPLVGLSALYAYESQLPAVSQSKIDGLRKFYGIDDEKTLSFFTVHKEADVWHSEAEKKMIEKLGGDQTTVNNAAKASAQALLHFLAGVDARTRLLRTCETDMNECMH